jgi:hypothetical protein
VENREGRHNLEDLSVDWRVILKRKEIGWEDMACWFRIEKVAGSCEHGNEPSGSMFM